MTRRITNIIRYALAAILLVVALNAFGGGWYGLAGARDVPIELLEGSPFNNYFLPSLVLLLIVGGSSLTAALLIFNNHRLKIKSAFIAGIIMLLWIGVQLGYIGYVSWLQPAVASAGVITLVLAYYLKKASIEK